MSLTLQTKQPSASKLYDFDFSGEMRTGETIASVVSVVATPVGLTVGSSVFSGQIAQVRLSGGTTATEYLVTCKVTTSASDSLELEGRLWVEDVASLNIFEQAALDELVMLVEANVCPTLDYLTASSELQRIFRKHQRATFWAANTAYDLGARIVPTLANRNRHRYRAVEYTAVGTDKKSGATEPVWSMTRDSQHTDNHVIWVEDGYDYDLELWDLSAAARDGWLLKAAKASTTSDVQTDALAIKSSQLYDHCVEMASKYQPVYCL